MILVGRNANDNHGFKNCIKKIGNEVKNMQEQKAMDTN